MTELDPRSSSPMTESLEHPKSTIEDKTLPPDYQQKFHKFIKKTLRRLHSPLGTHHSSTAVSASGSVSTANTPSDIFERSLETNPRSLLTNPETPQHYINEDYISPILDTTTEILNDPKVDFNNVKLNCYGEEINSGGSTPMATAHDGVGSTGTGSGIGSVSGIPSVGHFHRSDSSLDFRPRSRSIISASLISSLDHENHDPLETSQSRPESPGKLEANYSRTKLNPPDEEIEEEDHHTIEYYSFADMVNHQDEEEGVSTWGQSPDSTVPPRRKGSCYTISLKDYIGNV